MSLAWIHVESWEKESNTNVDEFLSVREGKLVANGGHDRLLACIEICVAM
jgi:hypothetical protein